MNPKLSTLLLIVCIYFAQAQTPINPTYLDINQVKAHILNNGTNFWDGGSLQNSGYEVPKGSNKRTIYSDCIWMGGKSVSGNLLVGAQTYISSSIVDFWPGPVDSLSSSLSLGIPYFINNNFKINKTTVDSFKTAWQNGQVQNGTYTIPNSIAIWPGIYPFGSTKKVAPFFDYDNDGNYIPVNGDYPSIKGDQAVFAVFNDMSNIKRASGTAGAGLEIRRLSYALKNNDTLFPNLKVLNYTTFHEYEIINKGNIFLDSFIVSIWSDLDIGGGQDDYIACDVTNQVGYAYNADSIDATNGASNGYLSQTPIQAYKMLNTTQNDCIDNDNDGLIDEADEALIREMTGFMYFNNNPTNYGDPTNGIEFYNYMTNKFRSGQRLIYGRNGIPLPANPNIPTKYCFPGTSDPLKLGTNGLTPSNNIVGGWSESNNGTPTPNPADDRRFVLNGKYSTLLPGQVRYFSTALITTLNPNSIAFSNLLPIAQQDWNTVTNYYNSNLSNLCNNASGINTNESPRLKNLIAFPNPVKQDFFIKGFSANEKIVAITITDINGKIIKQMKQDVIADYLKIDLKALENGVYFITVNKTKTFKVIKAE
jgi:Secretion system C-terminal sorting domain